MNIKYYFQDPIDRNLILDTFREAFGKEMEYAAFEWRFLNNPYNSKIYINYIIEDGVLASFYAVSPVNFFINKKLYKMALSCMTMTHPKYQGKGYFKLLASELYKKLEEDGFIAVFGFANQNSHYGFRKNLCWIDISPLNFFSINDINYKLDKSIYKNYNYKELPLNIRQIEKTNYLNYSRKMIVPDRSIDFLSWRLLNNPIYNYFALEVFKGEELIGIIYYKFYNNSIDILEIFYKDINNYDALINGIRYLINKYNLKINIWSNLHSEEHLILEKIGFKQDQFLTYFGIIPFNKNIDFINMKNWHLRLIDSDLF